jgi:hypothetical protein
MSVPACRNGCACKGASSEAEANPRARRNPLEGDVSLRARRNPLEGAVSPRGRRNPLEGGVNPRARRNLLEGAFWVGHSGGPRGPPQCGPCPVCALK